MSLERRLQHAGRELRGVPIDVPPLETQGASGPSRPRQSLRLVPALAAPLLFVAGGLFAYGAVQSPSTLPSHSDVPAASGISDTGAVRADTAAPWHAGDGPPSANRAIDRSEPATTARAVSAPSAIVEQAIVARLLDNQRASPTPGGTTTDSPGEQAATSRSVPI